MFSDVSQRLIPWWTINPLISDFKNICRRFHTVCFYFETCMITCSLLPVFNRTITNKQHFTEQHNNLCVFTLYTPHRHTQLLFSCWRRIRVFVWLQEKTLKNYWKQQNQQLKRTWCILQVIQVMRFTFIYEQTSVGVWSCSCCFYFICRSKRSLTLPVYN